MLGMLFCMVISKRQFTWSNHRGSVIHTNLHMFAVYRLHKSLYGLKQAPRAWFDKLSTYLFHMGFVCSRADPSMFVYKTADHLIILLIYVDDVLITGTSSAIISKCIQRLGTAFALKDLGNLHYFLGLEVNMFDGGLFLSQTKYTRDLLQRANMLEATPISTPLSVKVTPSFTDDDPVDATAYRQLVGALQYLTFTRPNIQFAVNRVCQFFQKPTMLHLKMVKRILRYSKCTMMYGLRFLAQSTRTVNGCSDADWAGCPLTRKSTSGYCVFFGANCISWSSKKQTTVSRSSAETEYRAMASATAELTWISYLLHELGLHSSQPFQLFYDNMSALHMSINPVFHHRTKHISLDYHFVREKVADGSLVTRYLSSSSQIADIFTKPLSKDLFTPKTSSLIFGSSWESIKFPSPT
nr:uncharacterized mitochondrial protein AtMg00810-like isoform X1 [Ziziphus jujuba var. spinosa]